ncbi:hypothetical protein [Niallia sp. 01092]|uniref:hypothetical protein n=1 Tax=unclassified Niallia TaxID=2837522 RepID=UPI003FD331F1
MSEYQQFLQERDQIDFLLQQGYRIKSVVENLNGTVVEFENNKVAEEESRIETLYLGTANARKYFSAKLIKQEGVTTCEKRGRRYTP